MSNWDDTKDFVIIGGGAGALCAALAAREAGAEVLVIEKEPMIGGSSALSGGTMWVPGNALMREEGIPDSIEEGRKYLDACVPDDSRATSRTRIAAYLAQGPRMIDLLRRSGIPLNRVEGYADYYAELPGANTRGRSVQCDTFDFTELGDFRTKIFNLAPVTAYVQEFPQLALMFRTWRGFSTFLRVAARTAWARVRKRPIAANGAALVGRLLHTVLKSGVGIWTESPVKDILVEDGRVAGVMVLHEGEEVTIRALRGALIASGGFARNLEMRKRYGRQPASLDWTFANPGETGDVIEMAMRLGAATELMDEAIWIPMTLSPLGPMYLEYERGKPHSILVDGDGQRYIDEGGPYMTFGQIVHDLVKQGKKAIPSWLILDSGHRSRYTFGLQFPGRTPEDWVTSGFMKRGSTVEELAKSCGIEPRALAETVKRFNQFAVSGVDLDFNRGGTLFSRNAGDPSNKPNPSLGAIEKGPFYAVAVYPGDLGTFGGILTDEHARVQREDGSVIEGLYATGNATAPVMGRTYPCTGASIASTMIFGMVAAQHALGQVATDAAAPRRAAG